MFSFKFSLWWSPVALKLESYCLQLCKKNCRKLVFWVFPEYSSEVYSNPIKHLRWSLLQKQFMYLNLLTIFCKSSILDVWLSSEFFSALLRNSRLNSYIAQNLLLQKSVINHNSQQENAGVVRLNQIMFNFLTLSIKQLIPNGYIVF